MEEGYKTRRRATDTNDRARSLRNGGNVAEAMLWTELKDRKLGGYKFVRQFPVGPYFADFLCRKARLVIEVDGSQHADRSYDRRRDEFMRLQGYSVLRVWSTDVVKDLDGVCRTILAAVHGEFSASVLASDLRYVAVDET